MKNDVIRERLDGLDRRNKERKLRRRIILAESLERRRKGQAREYFFSRERRA
jgi:hypothetical protein